MYKDETASTLIEKSRFVVTFLIGVTQTWDTNHSEASG